MLLESRLTGILGGGVIEVPGIVVVDIVGSRLLGAALKPCAGTLLLCEISLAVGSFLFLFFLLLEFLDNLGNHLLLLLKRHLGEAQQRVLQRYVARVHCQLVEHIAAVLEHLVIGIILAELRNCLAIARLCLVILALSKIDAAQRELAYCLVDAVARALLGSKLIVLDGMNSVATCEIKIAYGIVNLVEIFLVAVVARHALEGLYLAVDVVTLEHSTLLDASVKLGAVGRTAAASRLLIGLIGFLLLPGLIIELPQQEVEPHLLSAACPFHGFFHVGHRLGVHLALDIVVGKGEVSQLIQPVIFNPVRMNVRQHVVGLGGPFHGTVAQRLPNLRFKHEIGLPREVAGNVMESSCRAQEVALHILCLCHEVPGIVDEWVILLTLEPLLIFLVVALACLALGFALYRVQRNSLLHLLDGAVKAGAGLSGLRVAIGLGRVNEELCGIVVLIVIFKYFNLLAIVLVAVIVHVISRVHGMPKATAGSVLLGAARREDHCRKYQNKRYVTIPFLHYSDSSCLIYLIDKRRKWLFIA